MSVTQKRPMWDILCVLLQRNWKTWRTKVLHLNVWQPELFKYDQLLGLTGYSRVKMTEDTNILTIHPTHTRAHTHTHRHTHRPLHPVHLSVPQQEACCQDTGAACVFPVRSVKGGEIQFSDQAVTFLSFYSLWSPVPASLNACVFWEVCLPVSPRYVFKHIWCSLASPSTPH